MVDTLVSLLPGMVHIPRSVVCWRLLLRTCFTGLVGPVSSNCVTSIELDRILTMKWLSLLQMPELVVVWTIVTLRSGAVFT